MAAKEPLDIAKYLKERKGKVLVMSGWLCEKLELDGRRLIDYAVELANKLDAAVAATGNTVNAVRGKVKATKKMWAAEIPLYLKYDWKEPFERPEVVVLIGYTPDAARALATAMAGLVETVVLDSVEIPEATISLNTMTIDKWKESLEEIIRNLG
ncbi:MAG TPA: hypothetical protein ENF26_05800 [Methanomicrobia archaeon]|nr:hypothetical protein [Methanomicrobia archaeon]HEX59641.1 hypothetical protein [Methanomicrobia archaeon]